MQINSPFHWLDSYFSWPRHVYGLYPDFVMNLVLIESRKSCFYLNNIFQQQHKVLTRRSDNLFHNIISALHVRLVDVYACVLILKKEPSIKNVQNSHSEVFRQRMHFISLTWIHYSKNTLETLMPLLTKIKVTISGSSKRNSIISHLIIVSFDAFEFSLKENKIDQGI